MFLGSPSPSLSSSMASSPALTAVVAPEATEDTTDASIADPGLKYATECSNFFV